MKYLIKVALFFAFAGTAAFAAEYPDKPIRISGLGQTISPSTPAQFGAHPRRA